MPITNSEYTPRSLMYFAQRSDRQVCLTAIQNYRKAVTQTQDGRSEEKAREALDNFVSTLFPTALGDERISIYQYLIVKKPEKLERFFAKIESGKMLSPDRKHVKVQETLNAKLNLTMLLLSTQHILKTKRKAVVQSVWIPAPTAEQIPQTADALKQKQLKAMKTFQEADDAFTVRQDRLESLTNSLLSDLSILKKYAILAHTASIQTALQECQTAEREFKLQLQNLKECGCAVRFSSGGAF